MAPDAEATELRRMFVRHVLLLSGIGAALGMIAAAGMTWLMSSLLCGITALDPLTYATVSSISSNLRYRWYTDLV